jgi:hypothetical protein
MSIVPPSDIYDDYTELAKYIADQLSRKVYANSISNVIGISQEHLSFWLKASVNIAAPQYIIDHFNDAKSVKCSEEGKYRGYISNIKKHAKRFGHSINWVANGQKPASEKMELSTDELQVKTELVVSRPKKGVLVIGRKPMESE